MKGSNLFTFIVEKGYMECKHWLDRFQFDIEEEYAYNMSPGDKRQIRKIIYDHFEYIEEQWDEMQRKVKS